MVDWAVDINFASALLLHSCITVLLKETLNAITVIGRISSSATGAAGSVSLDGYTSILSNDYDGDLAELYFTNTGFILLFLSLASAIVMNLSLPELALNIFIAGSFAICALISFFACQGSWLRPIHALRRAGRFIWSDTPFVNFFTLIYFATVLPNTPTIRLMDYSILRSIAIFELVFMKAYVAAANTDKQKQLLRTLCASTYLLRRSDSKDRFRPPTLTRNSIVPFTTAQRLTVMLLKTAIGYDTGSLRGPKGYGSIPVPPINTYVDDHENGTSDWRIYRLEEDILVIEDRFPRTVPKGKWDLLTSRMHGKFLARLNKVRVVYLLRVKDAAAMGRHSCDTSLSCWISNINLVTGVSISFFGNFIAAEHGDISEGVVA